MAISIPMEAVEAVDAAEEVQPAASEQQQPENPPPVEALGDSLPGSGLGSTDLGSGNLPDDIDTLKSELLAARKAVSQHEEFDSLIGELSAGIERQAGIVLSCESAVESAKADLKYEREEYDKRVVELRKTIADRDGGQKRLPFDRPVKLGDVLTSPMETLAAATDAAAEIAAIPTQTDDHLSDPISVLGQKEMIKLAGQDAWESAKNREEPFGMGKVEIETLEANEITTIGKLEKTMRENEWWHRDIPKFGEKKVAKLVESLRVFRGKYPQPA